MISVSAIPLVLLVAIVGESNQQIVEQARSFAVKRIVMSNQKTRGLQVLESVNTSVATNKCRRFLAGLSIFVTTGFDHEMAGRRGK